MVDTLVNSLHMENTSSTFGQDVLDYVFLYLEDSHTLLPHVPMGCKLEAAELMIDTSCACYVIEECGGFPGVEEGNECLFRVGEEPRWCG